MELVDSIRRYIHSEGMLSPSLGRVGVALSGGADSVALLAVLVSLGYDCVALHCNFHLRGDESDRDEAFARDVAARLGAPIEVKHCDVAAYREMHGGSVEMACRDLRYRWFAEYAESHQLQGVALGHHAEDNAETLLINLLRGAGVRGLKGMAPKTGIYARPFLATPKKALLRYLDSEGIGYVTDSSNLSDDYLRNRLRHHVLPELERLSPRALQSIITAMSHLRGQAAMLDGYRDVLVKRYGDITTGVDVSGLCAGEARPADALYEIISPLGFNDSQVGDMIESSRSGRSGRVFRAGETLIELSRGLLRKLDADDSAEIEFDPLTGAPEIGLTAEIVDMHPGERLRCGPDELLLSLRALDDNPRWVMRRWRSGDRMEPFGMRGSRLLSDIYSDAHMSLADKRRQWVLIRQDVILWAVGSRASRHWAVGRDEVRALRLTFVGQAISRY